ncbi:FMN-binding negative transcriptional regulator, partial [bacterium]|nr:FMN-binding negative transcriptional regulator [bacterium]
GQLICLVNQRITSTLVPFLLSKDKLTIYAHIAKSNPQWKQIENQEVLISLNGPHDYISPNWYSSPGVPTWNYQAMSIYGNAKVFEDTIKLKTIVDALTGKYESSFETPWKPNYPHTMLKAIVGIEITISDIQCKYKLSQNKPLSDRKNIIEQLSNRGAEDLAKAMETQEKSLI